MHVNKVSHVKTINRVAKDLGEDEDWLFDVANEMETEDGVIWVYGVGEDGVMAFTDFGIESLIELIKMHKDDPTLLKRVPAKANRPAAYAGWIPLSRRPMIQSGHSQERRSVIQAPLFVSTNTARHKRRVWDRSGRSRGGLTAKIHLHVYSWQWRPIGLEADGGPGQSDIASASEMPPVCVLARSC